MKLSDKGDILESHCECRRGAAKCSHMVATALYAALNGLSKTDLPQQWMQRPKSSMPRQVARSGHSLVSESKAVKALDGPFLKRMDGKAYMTQKNMGWQNLAPEGDFDCARLP
ncbi:hypothetical protein HPB47_021761 [Ixodes persulcatus]|uniref:Uncharacterized protein n=1 Tax=Ixodes persulcatus TaxID=34615 RepID=A0AC60QE70_IXOPE|nr:hypothetical protein HPB47_021761 [Ixodes persulcatus]